VSLKERREDEANKGSSSICGNTTKDTVERKEVEEKSST